MKAVLWLTMLVSGLAQAETLSAGLDLRPSWLSSAGSVHYENEVSLKLQAAPNVSLGYVQEFRTTSFSDGYLKAEVTKLWQPTRDLTLTYEPRLYFPTSAAERTAGLVTLTRQYLKWNWQFHPLVRFNVYEAPILAAYNNAGFESEDGPSANRWFENRLEVGPELTLFNGKFNLKFPVIMQNQRYRNFREDAKNNDRWAHLVWLYPEVTVPVTNTSTFGVGYYTDNLIRDDFNALNVASGFSKGTFQVIYQQSI